MEDNKQIPLIVLSDSDDSSLGPPEPPAANPRRSPEEPLGLPLPPSPKPRAVAPLPEDKPKKEKKQKRKKKAAQKKVQEEQQQQDDEVNKTPKTRGSLAPVVEKRSRPDGDPQMREFLRKRKSSYDAPHDTPWSQQSSSSQPPVVEKRPSDGDLLRGALAGGFLKKSKSSFRAPRGENRWTQPPSQPSSQPPPEQNIVGQRQDIVEQGERIFQSWREHAGKTFWSMYVSPSKKIRI
jgi:hypothetical protein